MAASPYVFANVDFSIGEGQFIYDVIQRHSLYAANLCSTEFINYQDSRFRRNDVLLNHPVIPAIHRNLRPRGLGKQRAA